MSGTEKCQTEKWFHSVPEGKHKTLTHKISGNLFDKFIRETSQTLIRPRFQIKVVLVVDPSDESEVLDWDVKTIMKNDITFIQIYHLLQIIHHILKFCSELYFFFLHKWIFL